MGSIGLGSAQATIGSEEEAAPAAPTSFSVISTTSGQADCEWVAGVGGGTRNGFKVYDNVFGLVATVNDPDTFAVSVMDYAGGTELTMWVTAVGLGGESDPSNTDDVTISF